MWHILHADDGATIALSVPRPMSKEELHSAILDGSIVELLNWVPVQPGDTLFAPAGTIHAIGHGVVLCEIQQNSNVTYRLYDYGRDRELHIEKGLAVSEREPFEGRREMPVSSISSRRKSSTFRLQLHLICSATICSSQWRATERLLVSVRRRSMLAGEVRGRSGGTDGRSGDSRSSRPMQLDAGLRPGAAICRMRAQSQAKRDPAIATAFAGPVTLPCAPR